MEELSEVVFMHEGAGYKQTNFSPNLLHHTNNLYTLNRGKGRQMKQVYRESF